MRRVLLFGGSFNPLHCGHLIIARSAAEQLGAERVILIPGASPPHKQGHWLAPAAVRLELCQQAVADEPLFATSDWELRQSGPNYTLLTVRHFRAELGSAAELFWLVGMDSLVELATWYHASELVEEVAIVTAARPGYEEPDLTPLESVLRGDQVAILRRQILETPRIDISATDIRARLRAGRSVRVLVPDVVGAYLARRRVYE